MLMCVFVHAFHTIYMLHIPMANLEWKASETLISVKLMLFVKMLSGFNSQSFLIN